MSQIMSCQRLANLYKNKKIIQQRDHQYHSNNQKNQDNKKIPITRRLGNRFLFRPVKTFYKIF